MVIAYVRYSYWHKEFSESTFGTCNIINSESAPKKAGIDRWAGRAQHCPIKSIHFGHPLARDQSQNWLDGTPRLDRDGHKRERTMSYVLLISAPDTNDFGSIRITIIQPPCYYLYRSRQCDKRITGPSNTDDYEPFYQTC